MYALHMTVHIRERDGIEYLYFLAGKRQFYLGRKDDLKNINKDTLFKAAAELDKTFDKHMKRYVKSLLECVELMDKKDATKYISKRKMNINQNLSNIDKNNYKIKCVSYDFYDIELICFIFHTCA